MASTGDLLYQGLSGFGNKLADALREHKANRDERDAIEQKAESLAPILKQRMTMDELADEEGPAATLLAGFANSPNMSNAKRKVLLADAMLYIDKKEKQQQQAEARQIQLLTQQRLAEQFDLQKAAAGRQEAVFNRQQAQDEKRPKFYAAVAEAAQSPYDRRVAGLSQYAGKPWDLAATRLPQSGESVEQTPVSAAQFAGIGARQGYDPTAQDFKNLVREPKAVSATEDLRAQAAFLTAQTMAKKAEAEASGDSEAKPPRAASIRDTLTIDDRIAKLTKEYNETDERGTKAVLLDRINALRRLQAAAREGEGDARMLNAQQQEIVSKYPSHAAMPTGPSGATPSPAKPGAPGQVPRADAVNPAGPGTPTAKYRITKDGKAHEIGGADTAPPPRDVAAAALEPVGEAGIDEEIKAQIQGETAKKEQSGRVDRADAQSQIKELKRRIAALASPPKKDPRLGNTDSLSIEERASAIKNYKAQIAKLESQTKSY